MCCAPQLWQRRVLGGGSVESTATSALSGCCMCVCSSSVPCDDVVPEQGLLCPNVLRHEVAVNSTLGFVPSVSGHASSSSPPVDGAPAALCQPMKRCVHGPRHGDKRPNSTPGSGSSEEWNPVSIAVVCCVARNFPIDCLDLLVAKSWQTLMKGINSGRKWRSKSLQGFERLWPVLDDHFHYEQCYAASSANPVVTNGQNKKHRHASVGICISALAEI